jgi:large subunit ribosomal protein L2
MTVSTFEEITKTEPEKSLLEPLKKTGGRNSYGRITTRHQGGGHKRRYRVIDFKRTKDAVPAKVAAIEYDPNRSARSRSSTTPTARRRTSSRPRAAVGAKVESGPYADIRPGNAATAREHSPPPPTAPSSTSRASTAGQGGQMARSCWLGHPARRQGRGHGVLVSPRESCAACSHVPATVGPGRQLRSREHLRRQGRPQPVARQAPTVRGSAMNPVDHPHGGGEGKSKGGRHP